MDLKKDSNVTKPTNMNGNNLTSEHSYAAENKDFSENDSYHDLDYSDIYDCCGEWKQYHLRKIIYVMDSFRISHEAYHELRLVSKGHLPPIGRISKEKQDMSEEIPYEKHPRVSLFIDIVYPELND